MAGAEELRGAIEPGSTDYGDRQELEAGLGQAVSGGPGAGGPSPQGLAQTSAGNPLDALLAGDIDPRQANELPTTAGLSVGAGPGPYGDDPRKTKLRQAATSARSPVLRQIARNELRRIVREEK